MLPVYSVSEFIGQVNGIISGEFIIEGEVSQYKVSQGKWVFFDLKDTDSTLNCFSTVYMVRQPLEDGMRVRVVGYPKIYEKTGRFSFTVQRVELVGEGALKKAYLLLKERLTKEGLFVVDRKRSIPQFPERVGVIASRDSAAFGDFKRILGNRWSGVEVILRDVAVQGERAVADIVAAFDDFNKLEPACDVLVLIRGGGSLEDLAAFNTEEVVRAVYASVVPVVCGVGHERDESLADFAADVRASTPSNAAEIIVPDQSEFLTQLGYMVDSMSGALDHEVAIKKQTIARQAEVLLGKLELPLERGKNVISLFKTSVIHIEKRLAAYKDALSAADLLFKNVDPKRVLERGFSIVRSKKGVVVSTSDSVDIGEEVVVELGKGKLKVEVVTK